MTNRRQWKRFISREAQRQQDRRAGYTLARAQEWSCLRANCDPSVSRAVDRLIADSLRRSES